MFTLLPLSQINELAAAHAAAPEKRGAQRVLADEVTGMVHGREYFSLSYSFVNWFLGLRLGDGLFGHLLVGQLGCP
jgi:tyrosyl-tRNA synthetase